MHPSAPRAAYIRAAAPFDRAIRTVGGESRRVALADHLDAPGLKSPGMNARVDITDIYAFQKPGNPAKSILILNVNPLAPTLATEFDRDAVYEIKIDTNADAVADIAFRITFSNVHHGEQFATVRRATGRRAARRGGGGKAILRHAPVSFGHDAHLTTA